MLIKKNGYLRTLEKGKKSKNAIVFTLDAVFAIIAAAIIIFAVLFYTSQLSRTPFAKQSLSRISKDSLTVLEKDYSLKYSVQSGSYDGIQSFLDSLPTQICARIGLKDSSGALFKIINKSGCPDYSPSTDRIIHRRVFVADDASQIQHIYYAEITAWYSVDSTGGSL